jgi:hypothetical protein
MRTLQKLVFVSLPVALAACSSGSDSDGGIVQPVKAESCMRCHNGSFHDDYAGSGMENPHPFTGGGTLKCTECHGGDPLAEGQMASHVPPPPEIGNEQNQERNARAYFNRRTLAGLDKYADYVANGRTWSSLDYLQFVNPGDLRVVTQGRSCGRCHVAHAECSFNSPLATEMGILSGARFTLGAEVAVPENSGLYGNTASDLGFRSAADLNYSGGTGPVGSIPRLLEAPVFSVFGAVGPDAIFNNPAYDAANLPAGQRADGSVIAGSPLANLFHEQITFTCGDCHLGSAGANNRYGDFRSSGCAACHMRYSQDGRSRISDPRVRKNEPLNPDAIDEPERAHVQRHLIKSIAKTLTTGETVMGIDDHTCAGCHQGSNRTVMQYWGIRLDQNADLRNRVQYPANPFSFLNTALDTRLFDPVVRNQTFNGRNPNQYILLEDYDNDDLDDTPADVHYDAGLGCIDCHGSHDLHGGRVSNPNVEPLVSRMEQAVAIRCESCHGTIEAYAATAPGRAYDGTTRDLAMDSEGHPLRHVSRDANGHYFLVSRLDGRTHYLKQTRDTVSDNGRRNPLTGALVYSAKASYAMGRVDADPSNGMGPLQTAGVTNGFAHGDNLSCIACHASWTNNCIGCHLKGEYDTGNNFSNITGERIVYKQANADFTYQTPVPFQLGVDTHRKINQMQPNTLVFYQWIDRNGDFSQIFSFSDRNGSGNNPGVNGRNQFPALSHNVIMPHSIRGKVDPDDEGPRYCAACHLTESGLANFGLQNYLDYRTAMNNNNFAALDFDMLRIHIGRNTGNQLNSPVWVHMVAGLGSGAFLFDENGCPVNPLDQNNNRIGCEGTAPANNPNAVFYNLDRIVEPTGVSNASTGHQYLGPGPNLRDGALDQNLSGPLGATLIRKLTDPATGIVLDSWIDTDGNLQGDAGNFIP